MTSAHPDPTNGHTQRHETFMATARQIAANNRNAQKSTGPKTAAGKEEAAANAMKHGITAKKYLTSTESLDVFQALYAARRTLYPGDDQIIDDLVLKITFAHLRVSRAFEAEADILDQGSLAEMLVSPEKPLRHLSSYETANRKTLKLLEEELTRYHLMRRQTAEMWSAAGAGVSINEDPAPQPAANDTSSRPTSANERNDKTNPIEAKGPGRTPPPPGTDSKTNAKQVDSDKAAASSVLDGVLTNEEQKMNRNSGNGSERQPSKTLVTKIPETTAPPPPAAPLVLATPSPPPKALIQTVFDISWNPPPRR
jgi:hypothetical protein